ncbi:hypothetical protein OSB04_028766 [Centaurea solstitialis]|uniref:Reverse transcriptase Ty1/copia-type domain-containing protein n=1 Tax=Centaurea solstitialis TaxID=347529 RepID=A0AA38STU7_9ASTR|nr:hypothetical protein OSB04_028766 [Centaurea solstitialis]
MSMMGELTFFLGLQVRQRPNDIFVNQSKYVHDLLKRFVFGGSNFAATPMPKNFQLNADSSGKLVDQKNYQAIIGSLLYLTASRPDIVFSTGVCARFQCDPRESHLSAVKRILRYMKGTPNFGLWYLKDSGFELIAYTDSDHVERAPPELVSSSGTSWLVGRPANKTVFHSLRRRKTQLADFGYTMQSFPIYCDSKSAIQITANPVQHSWMKHIDIRYHFIKDHVEKGNIELYFVEIRNARPTARGLGGARNLYNVWILTTTSDYFGSGLAQNPIPGMSYDIEQPAITEFRLQITSMLFLSSANSSTSLMVFEYDLDVFKRSSLQWTGSVDYRTDSFVS